MARRAALLPQHPNLSLAPLGHRDSKLNQTIALARLDEQMGMRWPVVTGSALPWSFICSFDKHSLSPCSETGPVLGTRGNTGTTMDLSHAAYFAVGEAGTKHMKGWVRTDSA